MNERGGSVGDIDFKAPDTRHEAISDNVSVAQPENNAEHESRLVENIKYGDDKSKFLEVLREILNPEFTTLGHGTSIETAENILKVGLEMRHPDLGSTTISLFDNSKSAEDQLEETYNTIHNWPHRNLPAIVVLMLPNVPEDGSVGGARYFNSAIEEIDTEDTGYNNRHVVPSRYIRGYFNTTQKSFQLNTAFQPTPIRVKEQPSEDMDSMYGFTATSESQNTPIPQVNNDIDVF